MNEKYNLLISYLIALQSFAKDFHYYCTTFGEHLFMDEVADKPFEYTDTIRESILLCNKELPYSSKKYLEAAAELTPEITEDTKHNFELLEAFLKKGSEIVEGIKGTSRGQNALLDDIAGYLDKMLGLTFLQLRKFKDIDESFKKEECKACVEKAIDRAKAKLANIDRKKVADRVLDYEAQNLLVAEEKEESALDRVAGKLGLE